MCRPKEAFTRAAQFNFSTTGCACRGLHPPAYLALISRYDAAQGTIIGYKIPNGGTFQHAATYAAPLPFTAISNATEAVATVVGATLAAGDIVLAILGFPGKAFTHDVITHLLGEAAEENLLAGAVAPDRKSVV